MVILFPHLVFFFGKYSYSDELSKCLPGHINSDHDLRPWPLKYPATLSDTQITCYLLLTNKW